MPCLVLHLKVNLAAVPVVNPVYNNRQIFGTITVQNSGQTLVEHRPSGPSPNRTNPDRSLELALAAAQVAIENNGDEVLVLDMSQQSAMFDYFVIANGTSRRQLHAISEEIDNKLEGELNDKRMNIDGYDESRWIVLDYGTVVIHLFDEDTRKFYSLESLWADAVAVDISALLSAKKTSS